MRAVILILLTTFFTLPALAQVHVNGYHRKDGTYVQPHIRSSPDGTKSNNYGSGGGNGYASPDSRDNDNDGTPNYQDSDDNNNGISDDYDNNQYGH
jgi:hypothetical protein